MSILDKKDVALLRSLQRDGRTSSARLAEELSISTTTSWRLQKRLEDEGYIEGYEVKLNRKKLGFGVMAFVRLVCNQHSEAVTRAFESTINDNPYVLSCHNITGEADFLLQVIARDLDHYSLFIEKELRKLPGVISINSSISLREVKKLHQLPLEGL
ncbi:Lrp/AsnC family transcriptional regulator [Klebsiella pneumoniae]|uniref:Lrp/AsnC family transcriptional regulator n=1 Tax=Klebsiella pneumoniae TaxID=573 RepID=UPI001082C84F|nr:Lrp/AsnC family transcriptional regulator [Klebsiella pneumoniae]VFZ29134.1 putative transcriptional regulator [Klebsiella pneumoniae]